MIMIYNNVNMHGVTTIIFNKNENIIKKKKHWLHEWNNFGGHVAFCGVNVPGVDIFTAEVVFCGIQLLLQPHEFWIWAHLSSECGFTYGYNKWQSDNTHVTCRTFLNYITVTDLIPCSCHRASWGLAVIIAIKWGKYTSRTKYEDIN